MRLPNTGTIWLNTSFNPHRRGTNNHQRWALARNGMTVEDFCVVLANMGWGEEGRRYLQHALEGNILSVEGAQPSIPRAPRTSTRYIASLPSLSSDLSEISFGVEIECILPQGMS